MKTIVRNTRPSVFLLASILAGAAAPAAISQTITRGPYQQMLAPDAITLRWQTDTASDSGVKYGGSPATLTQTATSGANVIEHEIRLTGLTPDTTYYYSVGTTGTVLAGGDATFRFKTAPVNGTVKPTRIWVLGDSGTAGDGTGKAESVRDGYFNSALYKDPDFWIMLGDNAYGSGTEEETTRAIFQSYPTMLRKAVLWSTIGNHETYSPSGQTATPYFNAFSFPTAAESGGQPSGTERYYSFDFANIHFVCLDDRLRTVGGAQLTWLQDDLSKTAQKWIIAFWHAPPYSKGSHNSDAEGGMGEIRSNFLPILEGYGVDLVMCGHSHSYERSMLINGHYGLSSTFNPATMGVDTGNGSETGSGAYEKSDGANKGTVYVVGGNSGKVSGGALNHPVMSISRNTIGSLVLDIDGDRLDAREVGADGNVFDNFTLLKGSQLSVVAWNSVNDHAGTPRALPISDDTFVEPRQAGIRNLEVTFSEPILLGDPSTAVTVTGVDATGPLDLGALGIGIDCSVSAEKLTIRFSDSGGPRALPDAAKWRFTLNPDSISGTSGAALNTGSSNPPRIVTGLIGDASGNGRTSGVDLNLIGNSAPFAPANVASLRADINGDGTIDEADKSAAWTNRHNRTDKLVLP